MNCFPINTMPRKGETIIFDSNGMYPDCDGIEYVVESHHDKYPEILNIRNIETERHTLVIAKFNDGWNKYLNIKEDQK